MNAIKAYRKKNNMTQLELSNSLKVDQSAISQWENGRSRPRADLLPDLAKTLNCSIDDLFEGELIKKPTG